MNDFKIAAGSAMPRLCPNARAGSANLRLCHGKGWGNAALFVRLWAHRNQLKSIFEATTWPMQQLRFVDYALPPEKSIRLEKRRAPSRLPPILSFEPAPPKKLV